MTHTTKLKVSTWHKERIKELRRKYDSDDCKELYRVVDRRVVTKVKENIEPSTHSAILNSRSTDLDEKIRMCPVVAQEKDLGEASIEQLKKIQVSANGSMPGCTSPVSLNIAVTGQVKKGSPVQEDGFEEYCSNIKNQWSKTTDDVKNNGSSMDVTSSEDKLCNDAELTGMQSTVEKSVFLGSGNSFDKEMELKQGINLKRVTSNLPLIVDNSVGRAIVERSPNSSYRKS